MTDQEKIALLREALEGMQSTYCLHVCYGHDDEQDIEPEEHTKRCQDVTALLAATEPTPPTGEVTCPKCADLTRANGRPWDCGEHWVATVEAVHSMYEPSLGTMKEFRREKYDVVPVARPKPTEGPDEDKERLAVLRAKIASYDGGDRPMSPPVKLLREERELAARLAEPTDAAKCVVCWTRAPRNQSSYCEQCAVENGHPPRAPSELKEE